jgi:hypothetical protein
VADDPLIKAGLADDPSIKAAVLKLASKLRKGQYLKIEDFPANEPMGTDTYVFFPCVDNPADDNVPFYMAAQRPWNRIAKGKCLR